MSRNVRSNFLTDKATFGNSTMPIGAIVPIFKATDDKVTDNGVVDVNGLGQVVSGAGGGTGYVTDLGTIAGYPTTPIDFNIAISLVLFLTRIVKPEIMLNAATMIINDSIINITFLSTFRAEKRDLFRSAQE